MKKQRKTFFVRVRSVLIFLLLQALIVALAVPAFMQSRQIEREDTQAVTFVPDKVTWEMSGLKGLRRLCFYNGEERYKYSLIYGKKPIDRREELSQSDITVLVEKDNREAIVELRTENEVFYTLDDYNAERRTSFIFCCISFSLLELIWLTCLGFYLWETVISAKLDEKALGRRLAEKRKRRLANEEVSRSSISRKKQKRRKRER